MKYEFDPEFGVVWAKNSCALDSLFLLRAIGIYYDGMDGSIDGMRDLVDELVELAGEAVDFIREGKIEPDEEEEYQSHLQAQAARETYINKRR
jgi:hypothetical protein